METIEQRLDRLEAQNCRLQRQNRRITRTAGVLMLALAAIIMMGGIAPAPKVLLAAKLIVEDLGGHERLHVGMNENDEPIIVFYDKDGSPRFSIDSNGTGSVKPAPPPKNWAWPKKKSARLWSLTIWFARPKEGETQLFHNSPRCKHLQDAARSGAVDGNKITKQKLSYAYKHFADQLEPCSCCKHLFPTN